MTQLKGFDASHHNSDPAFNIVKSQGGIQFMYHKATEGNSYVDPTMAARVNNAHTVGLHVGLYHFARFGSVADALKEADNFITHVKPLDKFIDLPYVLDIEANDSKLSISDMTKACVAFLEAVKKAFNKPVMVYTYDSFIKPNLGKELGDYPLWLADYGDHKLTSTSVWTKYVALQYTDKGKVTGINGTVDLDWIDDSMVIRPHVAKPAKPAVKKVTHKVVSGDTVSELAAHYKTTVSSIVKLNGLKDAGHIEIGQTLKIN